MFRFVKSIIVAGTLFIPTITATAADYSLNRFTVVPERWNTNSYWLESDEGIVLIDAQLLKEDAKRWAALIKLSGKPVKGAIITHAHPDHYGGLNTLREELGYFPVITSKGTADTFEAAHKTTMAFTAPGFGDRFDSVQIQPDQIIEGSGEITLAGIKLIIEDIGPGESMNATLVYEPTQNILFSGDATMHHSHLYTGEGHSEGFLNHLHHIKTKYADVNFIYAGHGDPARVSHVDWQIGYIKDIQDVAKRALEAGDYLAEDGKNYNWEVLQAYASEITSKYPGIGDYSFQAEQLVGGSITGVIREFQNRSQK